MKVMRLRSNEDIVNYAVNKKYIRSYEAEAFEKWLEHTLDELIVKNTSYILAEMFYEDRS